MKPRFALRSLVLGSAAGGLALLAALTAFSALEARRHFEDVLWVEHTHEVLDQLQEERVQVKNAELGRRAYRARPSPAAHGSVAGATSAMIQTASSLQVLTHDNQGQGERAMEIAAAAAAIRDSLTAPSSGGPDSPFPEVERASSLIREMEAQEHRLLAERTAHARATAQTVAVVLAIEFTFAAMLAAAALWLVLRGFDERELLLAKLLKANEELDSFAHSAAHDLRAPLRAIDGYARILEGEHASALSDEGRRLLGRVRERTSGMNRLIEDLLGFARVGRQELAHENVDMGALARRAAADAADAEPGRAVELTIGALPPARGDPALLALVWNNLLSNAYKYSRGRSPARVEIGGDASEGRASYWIKDNGVGFDPRFASKLFKVFSRLHGGSIEGTGVGLALARRVLERHGGEISAESQPEKGATFRFSLPL